MNLGGKPICRGRQRNIFGIVVEEFIKTARPVSSEFLAENYDLEVSSATIRNDLAYLEELGFLIKPHTSGGRMPTSAGWHYFIEEIWEPSYLPREEMLKLKELTSDIISASLELKECASKFFPNMSQEFLKKFLLEKLFANGDYE